MPIAPMLAVNTIAAGAAYATERADIPEQYKWNTADLYPNDAAWFAQADDIAARIPKVAALQGKLGKSAKDFYKAVDAIASIDKDLTRLATYASMCRGRLRYRLWACVRRDVSSRAQKAVYPAKTTQRAQKEGQ